MSSSLAQLPALLAADIDTIVTAAADLSCTVDVIQYTAGEPAAPVGDCTVISVWIGELFNIGDQRPMSRQSDEASCVARPGVSLNIRIDKCYSETEQGDISAVSHAEIADCLHDLIAAVWCGIADLWISDNLMGLTCRQVSIGTFTVGQRQGGVVSATLNVEVEHDCAGATS